MPADAPPLPGQPGQVPRRPQGKALRPHHAETYKCINIQFKMVKILCSLFMKIYSLSLSQAPRRRLRLRPRRRRHLAQAHAAGGHGGQPAAGAATAGRVTNE